MPDRESIDQARALAERVETEVRESQQHIDSYAQADVGSFYALAAMREHTLLGYIADLAAAVRRLTD